MYFKNSHAHMSIPNSLTVPSSHPSPGRHKSIFSACESVSATCPLEGGHPQSAGLVRHPSLSLTGKLPSQPGSSLTQDLWGWAEAGS